MPGSSKYVYTIQVQKLSYLLECSRHNSLCESSDHKLSSLLPLLAHLVSQRDVAFFSKTFQREDPSSLPVNSKKVS